MSSETKAILIQTVFCVFLVCLGAWAGYSFGFSSGKREVQAEAFKRGLATYEQVEAPSYFHWKDEPKPVITK